MKKLVRKYIKQIIQHKKLFIEMKEEILRYSSCDLDDYWRLAYDIDYEVKNNHLTKQEGDILNMLLNKYCYDPLYWEFVAHNHDKIYPQEEDYYD